MKKQSFRAAAAAAVMGLLVSVCGNHPAAAEAVQRVAGGQLYVVRYDHWSEDDERGFSEFIAALGDAECTTVDTCLHSAANPFRASDVPGHVFHSDCAELPYLLRFYYAWKRGLPFSYVSAVRPLDGEDIRYTHTGNRVTSRSDVAGGRWDGYTIMDRIAGEVNSGAYRVHPDVDGPLRPDHYSAAIEVGSIRPGTMIYDPAGHVATVYRVDPDGRIHFFDAHPDSSLTRIFYDLRFQRAAPGVGAGFQNWRPERLEGAKRNADGTLSGGHTVLAANKDIRDFSDEQYYGNGTRPSDADWASGTFSLDGEQMDYYDYVRAVLGGGRLEFDPVKEIDEMVASNCSDLHYRAQAVEIAISAGVNRKQEPTRLPQNIYGTEGEWEIYSTPSRDARLKTAFKELRDTAERFTEMSQNRDRHLDYSGHDIAGDMLAAYDRAAASCSVSYTRGDGSQISLKYEDALRRLFQFSFDPYQCVEHRWGASDPAELSTCHDDADKRAWYDAEQHLRNQIIRTYEAKMDFTRDELADPGPGKGDAVAPDVDVRAYLMSMRGQPARQDAGSLRPPADDIEPEP